LGRVEFDIGLFSIDSHGFGLMHAWFSRKGECESAAGAQYVYSMGEWASVFDEEGRSNE